MNKTAIKNFAVRARNQLIEDITQKSYELGITKGEIKDIETFEGGFKIKGFENSKTYKKYEIKQREKLVSNIKEKGFDQTIEEVAYTWFNRFIALRFMEVNEYLPTGVRVLSSLEEGKIEPDIIKEALNIDFDLNPKEYEEYKEIVYRLMDTNDTEDLYRYLIVKQCNQLGSIMPMVFEEISDYTELLLPNNLLAENSIVRDLVESIDEDDYKDQVEIIGWLYQYYISEKKEEVDKEVKQKKKVSKDNIPAKTQLFTPKWIVKYMIENSLGRLWLESHPDEELQGQWKYYLEEVQQDPEVQQKLEGLKDPNLNPEDITVLDPSMGSGHILVYAFDVLYDIYVKAGYSEREIPQLILEKNLYGLDIDDRAGQLAAFALMMKARSKNRRIFRRKIELNVCSIQESNGISDEALDFLANGDEKIKEDIQYLVEVFHDAKEYGSILEVKKVGFDAIERRIEEIGDRESADLYELQYREILLEKLPPLVKQGWIISDIYDVVCTNPPYLGNRNMNSNLSSYLKANYPETKMDLFSVFIEKGFRLLKKNGFNTMVTMHSWMFLTSFEAMRERILDQKSIINLVHMDNMVMGIAFRTVATVWRNYYLPKYKGKYSYVQMDNISQKGELKNFPVKNDRYNIITAKEFKHIKGCPIAYWLKHNTISMLRESEVFDSYIDITGSQHITADNPKYLRRFWEINIQKFGERWIAYAKGGSYRKWFGNLSLIVDWGSEALDFYKNNKTSNMLKEQYLFRQGITWSASTNGGFSCRLLIDKGAFDKKGPSLFVLDKSQQNYFMGFMNSVVSQYFLSMFNDSQDYQNIDIKRLPIVQWNKNIFDKVSNLVLLNVKICRIDWNYFETSWDFIEHPLLAYSAIKNNFNGNKIETAFNRWADFTDKQFTQLKANEEELNRIFIDIYGLQDELTPEVEDKDITIRKADRERDIKSFISYAVGCMFGRYSLDEEGLIYAGGEFDLNRYKTFIPTKDNVLVMADDDYFEDDIVNRFVDFVKITFGEETLEENLDYIAETLGQKASETPRQTIRRYFLKDFYKDHVKIYQKRPIYWLFDSGKKNGFKALVYMHRYDSSTVARVRTDYLHKLQKMYEAEVKRLDILLESDLSAREKAAAMKKKESINKQIQECMTYDQVVAHIANQKIEIDLDDGVKVNYAKFQGVEVPQGEGKKPLKANLLAKI